MEAVEIRSPPIRPPARRHDEQQDRQPVVADRDAQTTSSPHYSFHTEGLAWFPVLLFLLGPIAIAVQGFTYGAYWRAKWLQRKHLLASTPILIHLYAGFMVFALFSFAGVVAPMLFSAVAEQMSKLRRDIAVVKATVAYTLLCSGPLAVVQVLLIHREVWPSKLAEDDTLGSFDSYARALAYMSFLSSIMPLWYIYATFTADAMQRKARAMADQFLHHHSPPRAPGVRMPPSMSLQAMRQQEERERYRVQMSRYSASRAQQTPSRVPLTSASPGGGDTPPAIA